MLERNVEFNDNNCLSICKPCICIIVYYLHSYPGDTILGTIKHRALESSATGSSSQLIWVWDGVSAQSFDLWSPCS